MRVLAWPWALGAVLTLQLAAACGLSPAGAPGGQQGGAVTQNGNRAAGGGTASMANTTQVTVPNPQSGADNANGAGGNQPMPATSGAVALPDGATHADGPAVAAGSGGLVVLPMVGCTAADYHVQLRVGGDDFFVVADSGSSSAAVPASSCGSCGAADRYDASTGTNLGRRLNSQYGSGEWNGLLYSDALALGNGNPATTTAAVTVRFGAMTSQVNMLQSYSCRAGVAAQNDGILGLGPDALLLPGTTSLLTQLGATNSLAHDAFALQSCGVDGNLFLGGYDPCTTLRQPFFVPMVTNVRDPYSQYYAVTLAGLSLDDATVAQQAALGEAIVDNGTSLMYVPDAAFAGVRNALANNANFTDNFSFDHLEIGFMPSARGLSRAQLDAVLPKFGLTFLQADGTRATLWLDATSSYLLPGIDSGGGTQYLLALQNADTAGSRGSLPLLLGNAMMKQHVVIFDRANKQVGFAPQRGCDATIAYVGG